MISLSMTAMGQNMPNSAMLLHRPNKPFRLPAAKSATKRMGKIVPLADVDNPVIFLQSYFCRDTLGGWNLVSDRPRLAR
jgi:hypothetical protein